MKKALLRYATITAILVAASLVGGCDRSTPKGEPTTSNDGSNDVASTVADPQTSNPANTESAAPISPAPNPSAADNTAAARDDTDAQTLDDADATGMTARVSRDATTTNEAARQ